MEVFLIDTYFQTVDPELVDCKYAVLKNTALSFQDEEEIWYIKFNI